MVLKLIRLLSNLQFAIFNLLSISLFSLLGTVIEQERTFNYYKINYPDTDGIRRIFNWKSIQFFSLNQIYTSFWFNILLVVLGLSLICCTFTQQYPSLKFFSRCRLLKNSIQFKKMSFKESNREKNFGNFLSSLHYSRYSTFQSSKLFYAYKGLIGRISPIFVHISLLLILGGAIQGTFQGFVAQELVPKTEVFHTQNLTKTGRFTWVNPVNMRVNDFWIQYNNDKSIKQFYSNISILNNVGNEIKRNTIAVNTPLRYKELTIYQTDWTLLGLRVSLSNENQNKNYIQLPLIKKAILGNEYWISWYSDEKNELSFLLDALDGSVLMYNSNGELLRNISLNQEYVLESGSILNICDIVSCTGLQIKSDPGVPTLYFGFALLIVSVSLSYLSFSQFWLTKLEKKFLIGGKTNRSRIQFEREFTALNIELTKL